MRIHDGKFIDGPAKIEREEWAILASPTLPCPI